MNPKRITKLKRPLYRFIDRKVIRIDERGVSMRGKHKQKWEGPLSWEEIASLLADRNELIDEAIGREMLLKMGAN